MVKSNRRKNEVFLYLILTLAFLWGSETQTQGAAPLRLIQTIPLTGVNGRLDHMAIDLKGQRLFVAAFGNNSVEVIDLQTGTLMHRIRGLKEPQGVLYHNGSGKLFVTNGGDGVCKIYEGHFLRLKGGIKFSDDADNIRYDPSTKNIYVSYGNGAIGIIDANKEKVVAHIPLSGHPESFQIEETGSRIFANVPSADQIALIDREKNVQRAAWSLKGLKDNFPMALDETGHRLFVGFWRPPKMVVYNTKSGQEVARLEISEDVDDIYYDSTVRRIYASTGEGVLHIFQQTDADHYTSLAKIPTAKGARTSLFVPEQRRLYLAIPDQGKQPARMNVYALDP